MPRRVKLTDAKAQRRQLDNYARTLCFIRAGAKPMGPTRWAGPCERCGKEANLQWSHIISRGASPALKWDPDNSLALCVGCHIYWWHRSASSEDRIELCRSRRGSAAYDLLVLRSKTTQKVDRMALLLWYEAELSKYDFVRWTK